MSDLSWQVLNGMGVDFAELARFKGPGFVIRTADAWESVVFLLLQAGCQYHGVRKGSFPLGISWLRPARTVTPDATLLDSSGRARLLVDAKYKTLGQPRASVGSADVYEAYAFLVASGVNRIVLVYPSGDPAMGSLSIGSFDRVQIGTKEILGCQVSVRGIAAADGLRRLSRSVADALESLVTIN